MADRDSSLATTGDRKLATDMSSHAMVNLSPSAAFLRELSRRIKGCAMSGAVSGAIKSAARVMDVLDLLAHSDDGLNFVQIRSSLDLPKSSLHGLLKTMTDRGFVWLDDESRRYRVGIRAWEAGQAYSRGTELARVADPFLTDLVADVQETVQMAILDGVDNVYIAKRDSPHPFRLVSDVGRRLPAHTTALGKVLLASLDENDLEERLEGIRLERFTEFTLTSVAQLRDRLEKIRQDGYGEDDGEFTEGLYCVAVPIHAPDGSVAAAVSVSIPDARLPTDGERHKLFLSPLSAAAGLIESALRASR